MALVTARDVHGRDDRWLGSRRGVGTARTVTLDTTGFPKATDGIVPGGTPVELKNGLAVAYGDGTNPLAGFTLDDASIRDGNAPVALLDHGRVLTQNLPVAFKVPSNAPSFVFVGGDKS